MKIDLAGPKNRGLAMGFNEFAGYFAVALSAWGTGYIASVYGLRPEPFYLGIGFVVFGLIHSESTILLMFILPIKAKYISFGTVIVTALTFLARTNVHGAYHLGGIVLAWLYFRSPTQWLDSNWWRWKIRPVILR